MRRLSNSFTALALGAAMAAALPAAMASAQEIVARLSVHWGPKHHSAIHAEMFANEVNKRAKGRLRIEYHPSGQLFGIREQLGAVTSGAVELGGIVSVVSFPPINENFNVVSITGMFDSYAEQRAFFRDDPVGKSVWDDIERKSDSVLLMYNPVGPVMTFSTERLDGVASMKGLKARALIGAERPMWDALGANTVSMPTREVYSGLQTGMINTINSPPGSIRAFSWWEFLAYGQKPYQYFADAYIMANATWFNGLPADLQKLLRDVGAEVGRISTEKIMQTGEETLAEFEGRGGVVTTLSGSSLNEFEALMQDEVIPVIAQKVEARVLEAAAAFDGE